MQGSVTWYMSMGMALWEARVFYPDENRWERIQKGVLYDADQLSDDQIMAAVIKQAAQKLTPR